MRTYQLKQQYKKQVDTVKQIEVNWSPMPNSPQEMAYHSKADLLGYGGAAGGGKTSLICGLAATQHKRSLILRREYKQLMEIERQLFEIVGENGTYNQSNKIYKLNDGKIITLGAVQHEKDKYNFQGRPNSFLAIDEATAWNEDLIKFLMIWLRSTDPNERCRCVMTFNPPVSPEGYFVRKIFAPWLDKNHPDFPFPPGELKWYATIEGKEVECKDGLEFEHEGEKIKPLSRTFIPAKLDDNKYLSQTNYRSVLQSLPEPLRSQMLYGDFDAALVDNVWQCIPTHWLLAANERWNQSIQPPIPQSAIGCDPSRGGSDNTTIAVRYGDWFAPIIVHPGNQCPDGIVVAKHVIDAIDRYSTPYINVDSIGVGGAVLDALVQFNCDAYGVVVSKSTDKTDAKNIFNFKNLRSYMWWNLRELLDPAYGSTLMIPPDSELIAELCAPMYKVTNYQIQVESKDEIRKRIGRSTDRADALLMSLLPSGVSYSSSFTVQNR